MITIMMKIKSIDDYQPSDIRRHICQVPARLTNKDVKIECLLTSDGRCWNIYINKWVIPSNNIVTISINSFSVSFRIHIALSKVFLPPSDRPRVIFKDGDPSNLKISNLHQSYLLEYVLGKRFGLLTIIDEVSGGSHAKVLCECDCGVVTEAWIGSLRCGHTKSCGCLSRSHMCNLGRSMRKHGLSMNPLYNTLLNINGRCRNPNDHSYDRYGGRGITVCDEWNKHVVGVEQAVANFITWAEANGWYEGCGLSIDRIDNDGNYEPSNCRWATAKEQSKNTRRSVNVKLDDGYDTLKDACDKYGVYPSSVHRFANNKNVSYEEAILHLSK